MPIYENGKETQERLIKAAKERREYLDAEIAPSLNYDETVQVIASDHAYSWMEAANHFNQNDPRLKPDSEYYTYKNRIPTPHSL